MGKATEKPKLGNVTIATVRSRQEVRRITAKLGAAGIESLVVDERQLAVSRSGRVRFGGFKVQVNWANARRAIRLLRGETDDENAGSAGVDPVRKAWGKLKVDGWKRAAIEVIGIMALAGLLAAWLF
jgi:hypothetical protein